MGAHPYQYVIEYQDDPAAALAQLRQAVFQRGDYYGAHRHPRTPEEALELSEETGTRSILDITRIAAQPHYCCAAPLTPAEVERYFGTPTPTVAIVEQCANSGTILSGAWPATSSPTSSGRPGTWCSSAIHSTSRAPRPPCGRCGSVEL